MKALRRNPQTVYRYLARATFLSCIHSSFVPYNFVSNPALFTVALPNISAPLQNLSCTVPTLLSLGTFPKLTGVPREALHFDTDNLVLAQKKRTNSCCLCSSVFGSKDIVQLSVSNLYSSPVCRVSRVGDLCWVQLYVRTVKTARFIAQSTLCRGGCCLFPPTWGHKPMLRAGNL